MREAGSSPPVVAVSGTSGAGKSRLVEEVRRHLAASGMSVATLHFDEFTDESDLPEGSVSGWLARGGQPAEWHSDSLERELVALSARVEDEGTRRGYGSVVLVEEPFGRARPGLDRLVGLSIHLEVPLHVALARRVRRQFVPSAGALDASATADLRAYLDRYLHEGAAFYRAVEAAAVAGADLVLDGLEPPDLLASQAVAAITRRWPDPVSAAGGPPASRPRRR